MVEYIAKVAAELDVLTFAHRELLCKRHVEVVDRPCRECVTPRIRVDAQTGLDVHRGWIRRKICHCRASRILQRGDVTALGRITCRIEDHSIAGSITV